MNCDFFNILYFQLSSVVLQKWTFFESAVITYSASYSKWWFYPITLAHNPTKFDGHWNCGSEVELFLKYRVITRLMRHMTRWVRTSHHKPQRLK